MAKEDVTATGTQLLDRAVAILKLLGESGQTGLTMTSIEEVMGLKQPTVHRIVTALERHGLIDRERRTKRYRLGLALFAMGATAADGTGLRQLARPALMRLAAATGDPIFLMARSGFNAVCVDRQQGTYMIDSLTGHVGGQIPMGVGPASQAILSFLPETEIDIVLATNEPLFKKYGGLTVRKVKDDIKKIRETGFALDDGELVAGISAIAVPILPPGRDAVASIAINLTSARLTRERIPELVSLLSREVQDIEAQLNPLESRV